MTWDVLSFGGREWKADVRWLSDMKDVVYDQEWLEHCEDMPLYYMYRGLYQSKEDREVMEAHHLRFDITVIPPAMLGAEYVKTAGHFHPPVEREDLSYTEVYQVLEGCARYILQKGEGGIVEDVVLIDARAGDIIIIPPNYGHVTVNHADEVLKMSNWVSSRFSSIYEPMRQRRGAAYYLLKDDVIAVNPHYEHVPELRRVNPSDPGLIGLSSSEDMYRLVENISTLDFLNNPGRYRELFEKVIQG